WSRVTDGLGSDFHVTRITQKNHGCCGHTFAAIDAAMQLVRDHDLDPSRIAAVHVQAYQVALDVTGNFHPATPFVFGFLGNVNLFHGRLEVGDTGGLLHTGEAVLPVVGSGFETAGDAVAYVRPHDLELERYAPGTDGIAVTLRRALTLGPVAQLELEREDNQDVIEVALPLERFRHQGFREGELLAVRPRQLRVFNRATTTEGVAR
ncbi:UNVERIFIED_CONTAM: TOBE-like domain-containing protein, partial [Microbacterium sp. SLM126]